MLSFHESHQVKYVTIKNLMKYDIHKTQSCRYITYTYGIRVTTMNDPLYADCQITTFNINYAG